MFCIQEVVLQQLKSSHALELLFVCAKANVAPVSQAAIDCLVLIWQWYLRKSPSASFSESQLSCFLGTDLSDVAAAQPRATSDNVKPNGLHAVHDIWRTSPHDSTASQIQSQPHKHHQQQQASATLQPNTAQLWSVTPVVDFAVGSEEGSVKKPTEAVLTSGGMLLASCSQTQSWPVCTGMHAVSPVQPDQHCCMH